MFTISDQVAQARHSRNQNYPPFYLNITAPACCICSVVSLIKPRRGSTGLCYLVRRICGKRHLGWAALWKAAWRHDVAFTGCRNWRIEMKITGYVLIRISFGIFVYKCYKVSNKILCFIVLNILCFISQFPLIQSQKQCALMHYLLSSRAWKQQ